MAARKRVGTCKPNEVDILMQALLKPTYVYRMARGMEHAAGPQGKSARTRADNARQQIHDIVVRYVNG